MSRRTERVAEMIRQELGRLITSHLNDPRIGFVTVTRVEVSADLSSARVFVSVMGEVSVQRTTLRGIVSAQKRLRADVGDCLALRRVPELTFELDEGVKRSMRISGILADLGKERREHEGASASEEPHGEPADAGE